MNPKELLVAFSLITWMAFLYRPNARLVSADSELTWQANVKVIDVNLVNKDSWCPDYRRYNKSWWSQKCMSLSKEWTSLRTEELLQKYGLNNYNEREVLWRLHDIKTEVLVCISFADSSIGKYLKSKNNLGNVGNNDRWDTVDYASLLKGMNAIGEVLNGRYLWQYTEVRQLAWSANPSWPNYATELTNWYRSNNRITNILNCLSLVNDKKTEWSYSIRRWPSNI